MGDIFVPGAVEHYVSPPSSDVAPIFIPPAGECNECDIFEGRLTAVEETLPSKQPLLTAGDNISIVNNVISALTGASPATATPRMDGNAAIGTSARYAREDHVHPHDTTKQDVLTAGDNISIVNNVISAPDANNHRTAWCYCDTAAGTVNKVVNILSADTIIEEGSVIAVRFAETNTASAPTILVVGDVALPIYYDAGNTVPTFAAGEADKVTFYMRGQTNWVWLGRDVDAEAVLRPMVEDLVNVPSSNNPNAVNVATGTDTTVANTGTLTRGTYLLLGEATFASNATGRRVLFFSTTTNGSAVDRYAQVTHQAANGATTQIQLFYITRITSNTTYYLRAYQASGSTLSTTAGIRALKLHSS